MKLGSKGRIVSDGQELVIPSLFEDNDYKKHMSISLETGLWQCFKARTSGNFVKLYSILENVSYRVAYNKLIYESYANLNTFKNEVTAGNTKRTLFDIDKFLEEKCKKLISDGKVEKWAEDAKPKSLASKALDFLDNRNLTNSGVYYVCTEGKYCNRLIIPFMFEDEVVFFQGRSLSDEHFPKYLNTEGIKAQEILHPFDFEADTLYITEGVLCCKTLIQLGYNATCINGSNPSRSQMIQLKQFEGKIILAMDNDDAGWNAMRKFDDLRKKLLMPTFDVVIPKLKDWNDMSVKGIELLPYLKDSEPYDWRYSLGRRLNEL